MKQSETTTTVTCDGCGLTMKPGQLLGVESPGLWRSIRVEVSTLSGTVDHGSVVDLCGRCVDQILVPGLRREVAA